MGGNKMKGLRALYIYVAQFWENSLVKSSVKLQYFTNSFSQFFCA